MIAAECEILPLLPVGNTQAFENDTQMAAYLYGNNYIPHLANLL